MRKTFATVLMVSALALTPAAVLAQSNTDDNATQSDDAMTEQDGSQSSDQNSGQSNDSMTGQAEDEPKDDMKAEETAAARGEFVTTQMANQTLSENYIGASVLIGSGEERESVGTVSQLIFDENDVITGAVVDVGGFLGIGAKPVGLQWSALEQVRADETVAFTTSLTREELENAPEFTSLEEKKSEENMEMQTEEPATEGSSDTTTTN